jgi:hypothetical protein
MSLPDVILYSRAGCSLCDEARELVQAILVRRSDDGLPSPALVERDIETDPDWERAFFATIPVVEISGRRLELATSASKLQRFIGEALGA